MAVIYNGNPSDAIPTMADDGRGDSIYIPLVFIDQYF